MKFRKLFSAAAVAAAVAVATATSGAGSADAAGVYQPGDDLVSIVVWSGPSSCMAFSWWADNGARSTGTVCGGVAESHFRAQRGHWVGLEPRAASDTAIACSVFNRTTGREMYRNSHYWDTATGSVQGILDTPSNFCMVHLN
ncbi:hypothetical protein [Speluncibacter jeojiensis]|uniref:Secreted protein n=1 Tax=Speluncibacter jeojiensis TaxID=2710754 RepID=A0A9X4RJI5_9ACTN|nr:hypothetical protein [Corynebacteriales bacterium D3-21]